RAIGSVYGAVSNSLLQVSQNLRVDKKITMKDVTKDSDPNDTVVTKDYLLAKIGEIDGGGGSDSCEINPAYDSDGIVGYEFKCGDKTTFIETGGGIPLGTVAMFDTSCPADGTWTRFSQMDGRFPLGASAPGNPSGFASLTGKVRAGVNPPSGSDTAPSITQNGGNNWTHIYTPSYSLVYCKKTSGGGSGGGSGSGTAGPQGPTGPQGPAGVIASYNDLPAGSLAGHGSFGTGNNPAPTRPVIGNNQCESGWRAVKTGQFSTGGGTSYQEFFSCIKQ
ncbi:MAG: hypothetical protein COV07_01665, partial [Candidatus Vogelbacteria bacterium CG10_big_fil_rev_8_21_14_0_10_45_14]